MCAVESEAVDADFVAVDGFLIASLLGGDFFLADDDFFATVVRLTGAFLAATELFVRDFALAARDATMAGARSRIAWPATTFSPRNPFNVLSRASLTR